MLRGSVCGNRLTVYTGQGYPLGFGDVAGKSVFLRTTRHRRRAYRPGSRHTTIRRGAQPLGRHLWQRPTVGMSLSAGRPRNRSHMRLRSKAPSVGGQGDLRLNGAAATRHGVQENGTSVSSLAPEPSPGPQARADRSCSVTRRKACGGYGATSLRLRQRAAGARAAASWWPWCTTAVRTVARRWVGSGLGCARFRRRSG